MPLKTLYLQPFQENSLSKLLVIFTALLALTACEKEQPSTPTIGTAPKEILDKVATDTKQAAAVAADKLQNAEIEEAPVEEMEEEEIVEDEETEEEQE
jgi:hypothetical protein